MNRRLIYLPTASRTTTLSFPGASVTTEDSAPRYLLVLSAIEMLHQSLHRYDEATRQEEDGQALARFLRAMLPHQTLDSLIRGLV